MIDHSGKNFPLITVETEPYWEGCRSHELLIQQCSDCGRYQFYPRVICTECSSTNVKWVRASGRGKVLSYTIVHRAISNAYQSEVPYVIALIDLDEGPTMMSNVIQCDPKNVKVGMRVEVVFEDWSDEISIPKFRPENLNQTG